MQTVKKTISAQTPDNSRRLHDVCTIHCIPLSKYAFMLVKSFLFSSKFARYFRLLSFTAPKRRNSSARKYTVSKPVCQDRSGTRFQFQSVIVTVMEQRKKSPMYGVGGGYRTRTDDILL